MAKLNFKYGAMNSGKSTALINAAYNYTETGKSVLVVKPSVDSKGGQKLVARAGLSRDVDLLLSPLVDARIEINDYIAEHNIKHLSCILVDEAQFLQLEQVTQLLELAKQDGISVIAYGLRTDFQTNVFPGSLRLFELADNIEKLPTMCRCENQAEFNCRKVGDRFVFDGDQMAIDGEEDTSYQSLCGKCYLEEKAKAGAT